MRSGETGLAVSLAAAALLAGRPSLAEDAKPMKLADRGIVATGRTSFDAWAAGSLAGHPLDQVFADALGLEADLGILVTRGVVLYGGWKRVFYTTGPGSPYAHYESSSARGDFYGGGFRGLTCTGPYDRVGFAFDASIGLDTLQATAADGAHGTAKVVFPSFAGRLGLGVCARLTSWLVLTPSLLGTLAGLSGYTASVAPRGVATVDRDEKLPGGGLRFGLSPGLALTGEMPF